MKTETSTNHESSSTLINLLDYRNSTTDGKKSERSFRVRVEVAGNGPAIENVKPCLSKHLERFGHVVSDRSSEWVFSVIAFDHGHLVELSVILRRFFRSTSPGTESVPSGVQGESRLRSGAWVYESLRFHGLFGVPTEGLDDFLTDLAGRMECEHIRAATSAKQE